MVEWYCVHTVGQQFKTLQWYQQLPLIMILLGIEKGKSYLQDILSVYHVMTDQTESQGDKWQRVML